MGERLVSFSRELIPPAAPLYIGRDDRIMVRVHNSLAGAVVGIRGRFQVPAGDVAPFDERVIPTSDRVVTLGDLDLAEGFLYSVIAYPAAGTPRRGQCYVELDLFRGRRGADNVVQVLFKDYIAAGEAIGWPPGRTVSSVEGPGYLYHFDGTDPAANTEVAELVPSNARWHIHSVELELVTDATVADRFVQMLFRDGTNIHARGQSASAQTASQTCHYLVGGHGSDRAAVNVHHVIPIPPRLPCAGGWRIGTNTLGRQGGDNYGVPRFLVEEWIED